MLIKTETELILKSRWVIPERLQNEGYVFKYDKIDDALNNILNT
jgi:NAD dependent epimerase/dehydratase family enzyme